MPDPTPQEVVEARERLKAQVEYADFMERRWDTFEVEDIRSAIMLLDELETKLSAVVDIAEPHRPHAEAVQEASALLLKLKGPDHG